MTTKTDVYSFGVVLLELFTGLAADDPTLKQRTLVKGGGHEKGRGVWAWLANAAFHEYKDGMVYMYDVQVHVFAYVCMCRIHMKLCWCTY